MNRRDRRKQRAQRKPPEPRLPLGAHTERSAKAFADLTLEVSERLDIIMDEILSEEQHARFKLAIERAGTMLEKITPGLMMMGPKPLCGIYAEMPPGHMTVVISGATNGTVAGMPLDHIDECIDIARAWREQNLGGQPMDIPPLISLLLSKPSDELVINDAVSGVLLDIESSQLASARSMAKDGVTPVFLALLTSDERTATRFIMPHAWTMPVADMLPAAGAA